MAANQVAMPLRSLLDGGAADGKRRSLVRAFRRTVERISETVTSAIGSPGASRAGSPAPPQPTTAEPLSTRASRRGSRRTSHINGVEITGEEEEPEVEVETQTEPEPDMTPVTDAMLQAMFQGAPCFALTQDGDDVMPSVTFPWGGCNHGGHGGHSAHAATHPTTTDHRPFGHAAYALSAAASGEEERWVTEVPSMRGAMGNEPGTCGWDYFLTMPVGDAERGEEEYEEERLDEGGRERGDSMAFRDSRAGVRGVEIGYIAERLKELGQIWVQKKKERKAAATLRRIDDDSTEDEDDGKAIPSSVEMYTHLFTHLLYPPTRVTTEDYHDPYSLKVQVTALIATLSNRTWLDFSNVSWRIRLGQVLWGGLDDDSEDWERATKESERVLLLLQILLACELVLRLDSLFDAPDAPPSPPTSIHSGAGPAETKDALLARFRAQAGRKVQWDILLARRWLSNIKLIDSAPRPVTPKEPERFAAITSWFTGATPPDPSPPPQPPTPDPRNIDAMLAPRHARRQVDGLLHFARALKWPNYDALRARLLAAAAAGGSATPCASVASTPLCTPLTLRDSYFPPTTPRVRAPPPRRPSLLAIPTTTTATTPAQTGWLSRSYLSGLYLPGEALPHLLISTLLEHDPSAIDALGFNANLYAGFQYAGHTWWSRYCIVGRVLAGYDGAAEEAGWVGPCVSSGVRVEAEGTWRVVGAVPEGWVDVVAAPVEVPPRALKPRGVARECDVRGVAPAEGQVRCEFRHVPEVVADPDAAGVEVRGVFFHPVAGGAAAGVDAAGLDAAGVDAAEEVMGGQGEGEGEFTSYDTAAHFVIAHRQLAVDLRHDVSFVAAWPCSGRHVLHQSYRYRQKNVTEFVGLGGTEGGNRVMEAGERGDGEEGKEGEGDKEGDKDGEEREVVIVNVTTAAERVLAYAWCAQQGQHALVARRGRTCGACAVREAWAVGVGVVVRVA
ncbi:hypothetical protein EDC01DRAFT_331407 [Geopyxis carbonaria]|nr:hypothetical protein EDC01DRAFT_331407 [Geopyxis carbonaria]